MVALLADRCLTGSGGKPLALQGCTLVLRHPTPLLTFSYLIEKEIKSMRVHFISFQVICFEKVTMVEAAWLTGGETQQSCKLSSVLLHVLEIATTD